MVPRKVAYGQFLYFIVAQIIKKVNTNYVYSVVWQIIYFVRSGMIAGGNSKKLNGVGQNGFQWSSYGTRSWVYFLVFTNGNINPNESETSDYGFSLRCLAS